MKMTTNNTNAICVRCSKDLIYSVPAKKTDTTTKAKIEAGYYNCKTCAEVVKEKKKLVREQKKQVKKQKQDNIKQLEETKTQSFDRIWRDVDELGVPLITVGDDDVEIINLPDHRRLMWIYKRHNIRHPNLGYLAYEEAKVIRRDQILYITQSAMQARQEITNAVINEEMKKEIGDKELEKIETTKKTQLKKQISYVDKLHAKANKEWESRVSDEWERMVKKPGYRDPEGNKAPRYHLLSDAETFLQRQALRNRQIVNIKRIDQLEKEISDKNQKKLFDGEGQAAAT